MSSPAKVRHPNEHRFEDFFVRDSYVTLKNYLYNYRERKRTINRRLALAPRGRVLEVGSGLSPILTDSPDVIYSELSFRALQTLKRVQSQGRFVVADGTKLPFATDSLDQVICSEVLEHVEDDQTAICELARVLRPGGTAYITVPHRRSYFATDDRYVGHFRRYERDEMRDKLTRAGLNLALMKTVLGPLEKVTMWTVVVSLSAYEKLRRREERPQEERGSWMGAVTRGALQPVFKYGNRAYGLLAKLDAAIMPRSLAAVVLFEGVKPKSK